MKSVLSNRYHGVRDFASFNYHRARYHLASSRTSGLADLVNTFNARKFVLTVTAGRSGSDSLTHRIGLLPDTTSIHEPRSPLPLHYARSPVRFSARSEVLCQREGARSSGRAEVGGS